MNELPDGADEALAPVREALLAAARSTVAEVTETAREQALKLLDEANREAGRIRATARAAGEAAARSEAALRSARIRRQATEIVLTRQNGLRLDLQRQVRAAATALRNDPRYPELRARLSERGRDLLGPGAAIRESPDGGVIAENGSRRLDLTLPTLGGETLESMTSTISTLWTQP